MYQQLEWKRFFVAKQLILEFRDCGLWNDLNDEVLEAWDNSLLCIILVKCDGLLDCLGSNGGVTILSSKRRFRFWVGNYILCYDLSQEHLEIISIGNQSGVLGLVLF